MASGLHVAAGNGAVRQLHTLAGQTRFEALCSAFGALEQASEQGFIRKRSPGVWVPISSTASLRGVRMTVDAQPLSPASLVQRRNAFDDRVCC